MADPQTLTLADAPLPDPFAGSEGSVINFPDKPSTLEGTYRRTLGFEPDRSAEVQSLAKMTRQTPNFVDANIDQVREAAKIPPSQFFADVEAKYPGTTSFLSDPKNMAVAKDDMENITNHEGIVGHARDIYNFVNSALQSGFLQEEAGMLGYSQIIGAAGPTEQRFNPLEGAKPLGEGNTYIEKRLSYLDKQIAKLDETRPKTGIFKRAAYGGISMVPQIAGSLYAGGKYALPMAGLTAIATAETGPGELLTVPAAVGAGMTIGAFDYNAKLMSGMAYNSFKKITDANGQPLPDNVAKVAALATGYSAAGLGLVKLGAVIKTIPGGEEFLSTFVKNVGEQTIKKLGYRAAMAEFAKKWALSTAEGTAAMVGITGLNTGALEAAKAVSGQPFAPVSIGELGNTIKNTAIESGLTMGAISLPGSAAGFAHELMQAHNESALAKNLHLAMADEASKSKVLDRLPSAYQRAMMQVTAGSPLQTVYTPKEAFDNYFLSKQMNPEVEASRLGVQTFYQAGGDIPIPYDKFLTTYGKTEHLRGLADDIKFNPKGTTARQAFEAQAQKEVHRNAMLNQSENITGKSPELKEASDFVYNDIKESRLAINRPPNIDEATWTKVVDDDAKLWAAFVITQAKKIGQTPDEVYAKVRHTIVGPDENVPGGTVPPEAVPVATQKPVKFDKEGLPIRGQKAVVSTIPLGNGEIANITHKMVMGEAEGLYLQAKEARAAIPAIEQFVVDNGGLKAFKKGAKGTTPEAEEMKSVPVRFKDRNGRTADEMAQEAFNAGLLPEPSADLLRETLKSLPKRGTVPKLADFYDAGLRSLEEHFSTLHQDEGQPFPGETTMEVAPGVFFQGQQDLFSQPTEDVGARYEKLRQTAIDNGFNPVRAAKWAKDQLKVQIQTNDTQRTQQLQFGDAGGVAGFGQGAKGTQELFQAAYHGTPHKFDEFSLHKIGTGQGAQTYGWGLYFAGSKDVAEHYREQLAGKFITTNLKIGDFQAVRNESYLDYSPKNSSHEATARAAIIEDILINQGDLEAEFSTGGEKAVKKFVLGIIDDKIETYKKEWPEAVEAAEKFKEKVERLGVKMTAEKPGHVYTVDIPDDHEYLDWEKPFSEQSPKIQEALNGLASRRSFQDNTNITEMVRAKDPQIGHGYDFIIKPNVSGAEIYRALTNVLGTPKEASLFLSEKGIPGLKYLDQMSRDQGKGTSNYVLFDDKLIKITDFYQNAGKSPRGSTRFGPEGIVLNLFKDANASTLVHESSHIWLQFMFDHIKSGEASEGYKEEWKSVKDWLGLRDEQPQLTRAQHEQFAKGFEIYLREGIAPNDELKGTFERFKTWLTDIYKSTKGLKVELSDDVRQFMDAMLSEQENKAPEPVQGKYVKNRTFDIAFEATGKKTARTLRERYAGIKNEQIVRGNQLAEEIRRLVPNKMQREGMFWYKAANGDLNILADALGDKSLEKYHKQIEAALNLPPEAINALGKVNQYYDEAGRISQEIGTIGNVRENYQNRIYKPEKANESVKTETKSGLKQSTRHAKKRVFDTEFEAAQYGKEFATTDVADALAIHNEELARVNTARKFAESMVEAGMAAWKKEIPEGWKQVGNLQKRVAIKDKNGEAVIGEDGNQVFSQSQLVAPEGIAKGLAAITDPNFVQKIDSLRGIQKYQGLVKTVDLSFSFFHHFTMAAQTIYQGGIRALLHTGVMDETIGTPEFKELEQDFVDHTGMTSAVEANQDILRNLVQKNDDTFSKVTNLPGVKHILKTAEKSGEFLFGKLQRFLKVSDYGNKISNWVADHPEATNAEVKTAKMGFAKEINAAYGGLNWEAMGMTKSNLSLLRLALLAPDWTISNVQLLQYALGDFGKVTTAGASARKHIITALVGGMMVTEVLNKIITGHFTDENKKGHKLEIEISPDVYVSLLRGGIGDIVKFGSMVTESGLQGVARFLQGKLAPFPRTAIGLLTNTKYTGGPIAKKSEGPVGNTEDVLKYLVSSAAPMPLGVSNFLNYMKDEDKTIRGSLAVLTGVGRYSKK